MTAAIQAAKMSVTVINSSSKLVASSYVSKHYDTDHEGAVAVVPLVNGPCHFSDT